MAGIIGGKLGGTIEVDGVAPEGSGRAITAASCAESSCAEFKTELLWLMGGGAVVRLIGAGRLVTSGNDVVLMLACSASVCDRSRSADELLVRRGTAADRAGGLTAEGLRPELGVSSILRKSREGTLGMPPIF
jgi:hypothetical protein